MKKIRVAINGFGRIGRAFYKVAKNREEIEIVAVNDLGSLRNFAYLLKYDTAYGVNDFEVNFNEEKGLLIVDGIETQFISEKDAAKLPWKAMDIDVVIESTGLYTTSEKANAHILAGAKRVVVTAPVKDAPESTIKGETILMAMNEEKLDTCVISSNASCTTCLLYTSDAADE